MLTSTEAASARKFEVSLRDAVDSKQVDSFMDRVVQTLMHYERNGRLHPQGISAEEVAGTVFRPASGRGYNSNPVERLRLSALESIRFYENAVSSGSGQTRADSRLGRVNPLAPQATLAQSGQRASTHYAQPANDFRPPGQASPAVPYPLDFDVPVLEDTISVPIRRPEASGSQPQADAEPMLLTAEIAQVLYETQPMHPYMIPQAAMGAEYEQSHFQVPVQRPIASASPTARPAETQQTATQTMSGQVALEHAPEYSSSEHNAAAQNTAGPHFTTQPEPQGLTQSPASGSPSSAGIPSSSVTQVPTNAHAGGPFVPTYAGAVTSALDSPTGVTAHATATSTAITNQQVGSAHSGSINNAPGNAGSSNYGTVDYRKYAQTITHDRGNTIQAPTVQQAQPSPASAPSPGTPSFGTPAYGASAAQAQAYNAGSTTTTLHQPTTAPGATHSPRSAATLSTPPRNSSGLRPATSKKQESESDELIAIDGGTFLEQLTNIMRTKETLASRDPKTHSLHSTVRLTTGSGALEVTAVRLHSNGQIYLETKPAK